MKDGSGLTSHCPPFVVKVGKNYVDALVLLAEQVLDRYLDVVIRDEGSTRRGRVGRLDRLRLDALPSLDQEDAESLVRLDSRDEVITEHACKIKVSFYPTSPLWN